MMPLPLAILAIESESDQWIAEAAFSRLPWATARPSLKMIHRIIFQALRAPATYTPPPAE